MMVAFSPQRKKEFRFIRSSTQHAYMHMHAKFSLSYIGNCHLTLWVILVLEHPRQIQVPYIKISFFTFWFWKLAECAVHYFKVYTGLFLYMYTFTHRCSGFVMCSWFPTLVGIFWRRNADLGEACVWAFWCVWRVAVHLYTILKWPDTKGYFQQ